ncbi:MAG: clostripain-related cysteine peptidase [Candidatus Eremiobacterota bacterium]
MSIIGNFFQNSVPGIDFGQSKKKAATDKQTDIEPSDQFIPRDNQTEEKAVKREETKEKNTEPVIRKDNQTEKNTVSVADKGNTSEEVSSSPPAPKEWTVLFFANGNCDPTMDYELTRAIEGAGLIGSDKNINFAAQISHIKNDGAANRFYIDKPEIKGKHRDREIKLKDYEELGKTNMGDGETLKNFLLWGMKKYPAKHYMVLMGGHGGAFLGCLPDNIAKDHLDNEEIAGALKEVTRETGQKLDIMAFDACFMACAETAFALKDSVDYMVGPEEMNYGNSWNYWALAEKMTYRASQSELTVPGVMDIALEAQEHFTLKAELNLKNMPELVQLLKNFSEKLINTQTPPGIIKKAFRKAQHFSQGAIRNQTADPNAHVKPYEDMRDLISLTRQIKNSQEIKDEELKKAANSIEQMWGKIFIKGFTTDGLGLDDCHGMAIYAPVKGAEYYIKDYQENTLFNKETGWLEVVKKYGTENS